MCHIPLDIEVDCQSQMPWEEIYESLKEFGAAQPDSESDSKTCPYRIYG